MSDNQSFLKSGNAGSILCRVIVPLWILTGAVFKLVENSPGLLPRQIVNTAQNLGIDLNLLLAVLITLELFAIGVMLFLPRLARLMAGFMLASFCGILVREMIAGSADCGCLGGSSPPPWVMLVIDGILLAAVVVLPTRAKLTDALLPKSGVGMTVVWTLVCAALIGMRVLPDNRTTPIPPTPEGTGGETTGTTPDPGNGEQTTEDDTPKVRVPRPLPRTYATMVDDWVGKRWSELDLAQFMTTWPEGIEEGNHYVIFYSRSCDHCQLLFELHFEQTPPVPTTTVAIPESPDGFDRGGELDMYCADCTALEMPVGTDWIITPPIVLTLEDGVVTCVIEGEDPDDPTCLKFH